MPKVRIMLCPANVMSDMYFSRADGAQQKLIKDNLDKYLVLPPMTVLGKGEDVAEEVFDLTNNPSRQQERLDKYGNGRSVSPGDIIKVDDKMFACLSIGWQEIS